MSCDKHVLKRMHKPQIISDTVENMKCKERIITLHSVSLKLQENHKKRGRFYIPYLRNQARRERKVKCYQNYYFITFYIPVILL